MDDLAARARAVLDTATCDWGAAGEGVTLLPAALGVRGWAALDGLMAHQWPDGMVPHRVLGPDETSDDLWRTGRPHPTSGLARPPLGGLWLARLWAAAPDAPAARALLPRIAAWHRWWLAARDPLGEGLVAILHPWEAARPRAPHLDAALPRTLAAVGPPGAADPRDLALIRDFRALHWDTLKMHETAPYRLLDPGLNALLAQSSAGLAEVAEALDEARLAAEARATAVRVLNALDRLWHAPTSGYLCGNRSTGGLIAQPGAAATMPALAAIPPARLRALAAVLPGAAALAALPETAALVAEGLSRAGETAAAAALARRALEHLRADPALSPRAAAAALALLPHVAGHP